METDNLIAKIYHPITLRYFGIIIFVSILTYLYQIFPFVPSKIGGFAISGISWIIMLFVSLYYILTYRLSFAFKNWIPWLLYIICYSILTPTFFGIQSTLQLIVPILVGIVSISLAYSVYDLSKLLKYFKILIGGVIYITIIESLIKYGKPGVLNDATFAHFTLIGIAIVIGLYSFTYKNAYLIYYFVLLAIPVVMVTRMGILLAIIVPIIGLKTSFIRKFLISFVIIFASIMIFSLPKVQEKTFHSGSGKIGEISFNNENFNTSGRSTLTDLLTSGIKEEPIFGHGPRSDMLLFKNAGLTITEAHNDYLQILYNYGYVGLFLFVLALVLEFRKILIIKSQDELVSLMRLINLLMFIPLLGFMFSDTTIKTSFSFMNYFFALLGIMYSVQRDSVMDTEFENEFEYESSQLVFEESIDN